jgi:hypothetical protein
MTTWSFQDANKTGKLGEEGKSNEKPMKCGPEKAERSKRARREERISLLINNLGIQRYILSIVRSTSFQNFGSEPHQGKI